MNQNILDLMQNDNTESYLVGSPLGQSLGSSMGALAGATLRHYTSGVPVKFKRFHPEAKIPKQATEFAGGWDVTATEIIDNGNGFVICKLGFALQPPHGYKVTIVPRSSLSNTQWYIPNTPSLIDSDFTGEIQLRFRCVCYPTEVYNDNTCDDFVLPSFPYKPGDRIGQMYLETVIPIQFEEVEELEESERGTLGYGSTGKKCKYENHRRLNKKTWFCFGWFLS